MCRGSGAPTLRLLLDTHLGMEFLQHIVIQVKRQWSVHFQSGRFDLQPQDGVQEPADPQPSPRLAFPSSSLFLPIKYEYVGITLGS